MYNGYYLAVKQISIPQLNKSFLVAEGENLMQALLVHNVPVASSCHGDGICGKCVVTVQEGLNDLPTASEAEKKLLDKLNLSQNKRLSCQCKVLGNLKLKTGYW